jgi:hypothetical protein
MKLIVPIVAIVVALVIAVGAGGVFFVYHLLEIPDQRERDELRQAIVEVRSGSRPHVLITDEVVADEFIQATVDFKPEDRLKVRVMYLPKTDDFLRQIAGARGIQKLNLGKTGVTDAGMPHVATLPDLEELVLYKVRITAAGLNKLALSPRLKNLDLNLRDETNITEADLAALQALLPDCTITQRNYQIQQTQSSDAAQQEK